MCVCVCIDSCTCCNATTDLWKIKWPLNAIRNHAEIVDLRCPFLSSERANSHLKLIDLQRTYPTFLQSVAVPANAEISR